MGMLAEPGAFDPSGAVTPEERWLPIAWSVLAASAPGVKRFTNGTENQDAFHVARNGGLSLRLAVSDGHGAPRHWRSRIGARIAVRCTGNVLDELTSLLADAVSEKECRA